MPIAPTSADEARRGRARVAAPVSSAAEIEAVWPQIVKHYPGDAALVRVALDTGAAFVHREPGGFAVLSIHYSDFGARELYTWFVHGRSCGQYTPRLRELARTLECERVTVIVETPALLRLMKQHGWQPRAVQLEVEV